MSHLPNSQPMPVKHWSFAGLLLTYWCNARCASCYVCSSPEAGQDMSVEDGLAFWEGLQSASPHGCRIHIGGGEPFGRWERLIELARRAKAAGLDSLEAVETNAFWASSPAIVRDRLEALDDAGLGRLTISADPYHQQFVPIRHVRLAASVAGDVLGPQRVRVRWQDWAESGFDTDKLPAPQRRELFASYLRLGRERLTGRAAAELAGLLDVMPAATFADNPCRQMLLRGRHVHVDGAGRMCPGTCAGIVLAQLGGGVGAAQAWQELNANHARMEVVGVLAAKGPYALALEAQELGYSLQAGYAGKCHLCWDVRRWLLGHGHFAGRLGPGRIYGLPEQPTGSGQPA